jgi:hypothetical protein
MGRGPVNSGFTGPGWALDAPVKMQILEILHVKLLFL